MPAIIHFGYGSGPLITLGGVTPTIVLSAASLSVSGFPNPDTAGNAGSVTVRALDANGNTATGYRGTIHFTSSDGNATLPGNYAFQAGDAGTHTFTSGVTLNTAGTQSLTATDTITGSITGTQNGITVNTSGGALMSLTLAGGTVTFGAAFAQGVVPSGTSLVLTHRGGAAVPTQTDVLRTYADGSIKHAAITALNTVAGLHDLAAGNAASGSFTPTVPTVVVTLANACWAQATTAPNPGYSGTTASFSWAPTAAATVTFHDGSYIGGLVFTAPGTDAPGTGAVTLTDHGTGSGAAITAWTNYTLTATMPGGVGTDLWLSGALVKCWRRTVAFKDQNNANHPSLQAVIDVYVYSDGSCLVDLAVENTLDVPGNNTVTCTPTVTINGSTAFTGPSNSVNYSGQRWLKALPAAGLAQVPWYGVTAYDYGSAIKAQAVPRIDSRLVHTTFTEGSGAGWKILPNNSISGVNIGDLDQAFFNTGGAHSYLYAYPAWQVMSMAYPADVTTYNYMLRMSEQFGGFPSHLRNSDGTYVLDGRGNGFPFAGQPNQYWIDPRSHPFGNGPAGNNGWNGPDPGYEGDNAHAVNHSFVPYLVTGRRHYADEFKYQASYVIFSEWPPSASMPAYNSLPNATRANGYAGFQQSQPRSVAWSVRTLALSAAYTPDSDTEWKTYVTSYLNTTLNYIDQFEAGTLGTGRPGGSVFPATWGLAAQGVPAGYFMNIRYQQDYIAWALEIAHGLGYTGGENYVLDQTRYAVSLLISDNNSQAGPNYYPSIAGAMEQDLLGTTSSGVPSAWYNTLTQPGLYWRDNPPTFSPPISLSVSPYRSNARIMALILNRRGNSTDQANAAAALAVLTTNSVESIIFPANQFIQFALDAHYWQ